MGQVITWLFITGLIVLGMAGLRQAFRLWRRSRATRHWATAEGTVAASTVDSRWNEEQTDYWIEYTYSVAGHRYTGKRIGFSASVRPRSRADQIAHKAYYVGAPVTVYYNPEKPEDALLQRDVPWGEVSMLLVGAFAALAWALVLIVPRP